MKPERYQKASAIRIRVVSMSEGAQVVWASVAAARRSSNHCTGAREVPPSLVFAIWLVGFGTIPKRKRIINKCYILSNMYSIFLIYVYN